MADRHLARLLLVDNSPDYIDPVRDRLINDGWRADVASSPETAIEKVLETRYHICVLDKRLKDEHNLEDRSGIDLIPALWRIDGLLHFVMLTGYEEVGEAVRLTRGTFPTQQHWCDAYVPKKEEFESLVTELERVESDALTLDWNLSIDDTFLDTVLEPLLRETETGLRKQRLKTLTEDARLLLQWIFYDRPHNLKFELLDAQGRSGARILRASADDSAGWILKLATRLAIEEEWDNFVADVRSPIGQRPEIGEGRCQVGRQLGVIAYSKVAGIKPDTQLHDLRGFLADPKVDAVAASAVLESVVSIARPWFSRERVTSLRDLTAYYTTHFHISIDDLLQRFRNLNLEIEDVASDPTLPQERIGGEVMNPLPFIARGQFLVESDWNICHGDLNASNILMPEGVPWLIDFASTGPGPTCLDWVTLEASLKFDHPWNASPDIWFRFEEALVLQEELDQRPAPPADLDQELGRLFYAVVTLRSEVARQARPKSGLLEYLIGLLYATLNQVRFYWRKDRNRKVYRLLASAGLIAERLAGMGINRTEIGFAYRWCPSGPPESHEITPYQVAQALRSEDKSPEGLEELFAGRTIAAQLESLQITREDLLYSVFNEILGRKVPGEGIGLAQRFKHLELLKQRIKKLRSVQVYSV